MFIIRGCVDPDVEMSYYKLHLASILMIHLNIFALSLLLMLTGLDTPPSLITVSTAVLPPAVVLTPAVSSPASLSRLFSGGAPEETDPLGSHGLF